MGLLQLNKGTRFFGWLKRMLQNLPLTLPVGLAIFGVVAMFFLLINQLRGIFVWPIGFSLAGLGGYLVSKQTVGVKRPGSHTEQLAVDVLVVVLVSMWVVVNLPFTSQHIYVNRDPGIYSVTATWLTKHNDLHIRGSDAFGDLPQISHASAGFDSNPADSHKLFAQGAHLLPAMLGLAGRIIGVGPMLHLNVLFGGTALLALYGFARFLIRPRWALLAVVIFAVSLPLIYFSRDIYTEPLAATLTFGGLSLLWIAQIKRTSTMWFLAGLVFGAGALTRIDAYLTIAIITAYSVITLSVLVIKNKLQAAIHNLLLLAGLGICGFIGWLDVSQLSSNYYTSEWVRLVPELSLIAAVIAAGVVIVDLSWRTGLIAKLDKLTSWWRATAAALCVVLIGAVLASRPLWYRNYGAVPALNSVGVLVTVTGRKYGEYTVNWLVWYTGLATVIAGFMGLSVAAYRLMKHDGLILLSSLMVIGGTMLLYLIRPSISPDQIWAARRLLPIILPGLIIFAAAGLEWLSVPKTLWLWRLKGKTLAIILATLAVTGSFATSYTFLTKRTYVPQLAQIQAVCSSLPPHAAVLLVGLASQEAVQSLRTFCDVPTEGIGVINQVLLTRAAQSARARGYQPVIGIFGSDIGLIPVQNQKNIVEVHRVEWQDLEQTFTSAPKTMVTTSRSVLLGSLSESGVIKPLP